MEKLLFGVDLGGTKLEGLVYSASERKTLFRERIATEAHLGYQHFLTRIQLLVDRMISGTKHQPPCIGFGTPGKWDPQKQSIRNSNTVCLNGKSLKVDLERILKCDIHISNDANCFVLAESRLGKVASIESDVVFGIIMGTGVGGGWVIHNQLINGLHGIAGEWGHNFLDVSGGKCYCGKSGCVETVISGTALETYYAGRSNGELRLPVIVEQAQKNNEVALETVHRLHHFFGKAIANVINIMDPDVILIGGGVGNIDSLYTEGVNCIRPFLFNDVLATRFMKPSLGDSAGVFGAALLCENV